MRTTRTSKWRLFQLEEKSAGSFVLHDLRGNEIELTLNGLVELVDLLSEAAQEELAAFEKFLEMEYSDWSQNEREWRNFATTGDPNVSPEQYYKSE